ncbi:MAG: FKBP-type peptidyl-prolyl cis-trans isomerase [Chitinophagaceae bacterium]|nr:MAG: FKBP-type peptidyl-prolyl cis-trans isomerase [Chitinophagaceae bacterium]
MRITVYFSLVSLLFFMISCGDNGSSREETTERPVMQESPEQPKTQLDRDVEIIQDYMRERNIIGDRKASGLHYKITQEGTGAQAQPGNTVRVHYTGYLLDGTVFDSSEGRNEPIEFILGQGMVISGWDEGISLLREGDKATLFIPSPLAYGSQGAGDLIAPNTVLIFDVELVEVI